VKWKHLGAGVEINDPHLSVFLNPAVIEIGDRCRLDGAIKVEGGQGVTLGEGVHIASFSHINAGAGTVIMGKGSGCASHVVICGGMTDIAMLMTTPQDGNVAKRMVTVIGEHVCIFAHAVILPGLTLGDHCIVGAGSVVTKDVPAGAVVVGNPARVVKYRQLG